MDFYRIARALNLDRIVDDALQQEIWKRITDTIDTKVGLHVGKLLTDEQFQRIDLPETADEQAFVDALNQVCPDLDLIIDEAIDEYIEEAKGLMPDRPADFDYSFSASIRRSIPTQEARLAERVRRMGHEHRHTLAASDELARRYTWVDRLADAKAIHERNLAIRERTLGANHRDTLMSRRRLAEARVADQGVEQAISALCSISADSERVLGTYDRDTLSARRALGELYLEAERPDLAIGLLRSTLTDTERVFKPADLDIAATRDALADAYIASGQRDMGVALYTSALTRYEQILEADSYQIRRIHNKLNALRETDS